jgi:hypothetical protein
LEHNSRKRDGVERIQNKLTGQGFKLWNHDLQN